MSQSPVFSAAVDSVSAAQKLIAGGSSASQSNSFDATLGALEQIVPPGTRGDEITEHQIAAARKVHAAGIKWVTQAEKQLSESLRAVKSLHLSVHAASLLPQAALPGKEDNRKRKRTESDTSVQSKQKTKFTKAHVEREPVHGEQVAARVASHELWILCTIDTFDLELDKLTVVDEHTDDLPVAHNSTELHGRRYPVTRDRILQLPNPATAECLLHSINSRVMAMYPDTTTFYPALVTGTGIVDQGEECCTVQFDDDEGDFGLIPHRKVPVRFVTVR